MAVTITIFLMRHGLSCSNVLDGCMTHIENVDQAFQPHIFDAIDRELVDTPFDRAVATARRKSRRRLHAGLGAAGPDDGESAAPRRLPGPEAHGLRRRAVGRGRRVAAAVFKAGVGDVLNIATSPRDGAARLPRRRGARGAVPGRARALESGDPARQRAARAGRRVASARRRRAQFKRLGSIFVVFGGDGRAARRNRSRQARSARRSTPRSMETARPSSSSRATATTSRRSVVWTRSRRTTRCCGGVL